MGAEGLFDERRVELLDGEIIDMAAKLSGHSYTVYKLPLRLRDVLGTDVIVRAQDPVEIDDRSEPEPDVVVCKHVPDEYASAHPTAAQVLLVIEVAESSLAYDRTRKARAYARTGIPCYWIVNLVDRRVEVYTDPDPAKGRYRSVRHVGEAEEIATPLGPTLAVSSFLPPPA